MNASFGRFVMPYIIAQSAPTRVLQIIKLQLILQQLTYGNYSNILQKNYSRAWIVKALVYWLILKSMELLPYYSYIKQAMLHVVETGTMFFKKKRKACSDENEGGCEWQGSMKKLVIAGPSNGMEGVESWKGVWFQWTRCCLFVLLHKVTLFGHTSWNNQ